MKILITGTAGFIGFHLAKRLLVDNHSISGIDNHNDYYSQKLKDDRINILEKEDKYDHYKLDLNNHEAIFNIFKKNNFDIVINLAAQAGVRYSTQNPRAYIESNLVGFSNILEACRSNEVKHLIYASSSSIYGANSNLPFKESNSSSHPLSLYAATKKSNEELAHSYSYMYGLPSTGLRFFTVYGPWGRHDMALFKFTKSILEGKPIEIFNNGNHKRDFTYIDDVVEVITKIIDNPSTEDKNWNSKDPDPSSSCAPWKLYNVGNGNPRTLMEYIEEIEKQLKTQSIKKFLPMQLGDVPETSADISLLKKDFNYIPKTSIEEGIEKFLLWYKSYYKVNE